MILVGGGQILLPRVVSKIPGVTQENVRATMTYALDQLQPPPVLEADVPAPPRDHDRNAPRDDRGQHLRDAQVRLH